MKVKTLIADDSVVYRSQIRAALEGIPGVEVVGAASNGRLAVDRIRQSVPDLLILDLEMPEKNGIETLRELRVLGIKCQVIVFSSTSKRSADLAIEALNGGAIDFVVKPSSSHIDGTPAEKIRELLFPRIQALFDCAKVQTVSPGSDKFAKVIWDLFNPKVVVIGSSTGGPTVLETLFEGLHGMFAKCPILITQHMPPIFTASLAQRLSKMSGLEVREAVHGEDLNNATIYIAPGDYHLVIRGSAAAPKVALLQTEKVNSVRPAVDLLFESAAQIFRESCLGIVLTGMGYDGKTGAEAVKQNGGAVVIQEESSCVVFGMPGAVHASGAYDKIATPETIRKILKEKVLTSFGATNVQSSNNR